MKVEVLLKKIGSLENKKKILDGNIAILVSELQSTCPHPSIEQSGGEEWWDPLERNSHGWNPYVLKCRQCGLIGSSRSSRNEGREDEAYTVLKNIRQRYH